MRYLINVNLTVLVVLFASSLTAAATPYFSAKSFLLIASVNTSRVNTAPETPALKQQEKSGNSIISHTRNEGDAHNSCFETIEYLFVYPGLKRGVFGYQLQLERDLKVAPRANSNVMKQIANNIKDLAINIATHSSGHAEDDKIAHLSPMNDQEFEVVKKAVTNQLSFNQQKAQEPSNRSRR
jgi:hypothetical protein